MIKKIQLRGISRTPSERANNDGGCAESLNVQMEDGDIIPVVAPSDITASQTTLATAPCVVAYIHKLATSTQYIGYSAVTGGFQFYYLRTSGVAVVGWQTLQLISCSSIKSITSIGNTLIIITDSATHYALFKNGTYNYLGTTIPEPTVEFTSVKSSDVTTMYQCESELGTHIRGLFNASQSVFNDAVKTYYGSDEKVIIQSFSSSEPLPVTILIDDVTSSAWTKIMSKTKLLQNQDIFTRPLFIRYALKLYDGSYVYSSEPILLGVGISNDSIDISFNPGVTGSQYVRFEAKLKNNFTASAKLKLNVGDWSDIIVSVDIFISTDISNPEENAIVFHNTGNTHTSSYPSIMADPITFTEFTFKAPDKKIEDILTDKANFYLVDSIPVEQLSANAWTTKTLKPYSQDDLVVKTTMPFDYRSANNPQALNGAFTYNERLIGYGIRETLTRGYKYYPAPLYSTGTPAATPTYSFKFYCKTTEGVQSSVLAHWGNDDSINFPQGYDTSVITQFGYLCFPDSRCFKVEIKNNTTGDVYTLPMKEHPNLDCAYYFYGDLTTSLATILASLTAGSTFDTNESREMRSPYELIMSETSNPFVMPASGRRMFGSSILSVATTTKALSQGQFGQFPLYVFTEDGIHSLEITADGSMGGHSPLSRDVAIAPTISPIEQAIVFVSEQGVMMLAGSDIKNISPYMNGKHYTMESDAAEMLGGTTWNSYKQSDTQSFLTFMKAARAVYDYAGHRLVFFNESKTYQYVFRISEQTWHKMYFTGKTFVTALNGYPDAYVTMKDTSTYHIYDISSFLDAGNNNQTILPGIICTRKIDLGLPDIYKKITRIRLRGDYQPGHAKYILLASVDGRDFSVIHSLRGQSYKAFRLIILTNFTPEERLTYVEIEYEQAFVNKIR